ncbi:MAG: hypothetical protein GY754_38960 [bacterium]|nr:hypothetical protein [bacterium]
MKTNLKKLILTLVTLLILFCITAGSAFANPRIQKIRAFYNSITEDSGNTHEIKLNTMMPAIGLQTTTIRFIYFSMQADAEKDPYMLKRTLAKVIVEYNISASMKYHIEYLYNEKGRLIFYFYKVTGGENREERCYFFKNRLIKIKVNPLKNEEGITDSSPRFNRTKNFTKKDRKKASRAVGKANKYRKTFTNLVSVEHIDK